MSMRQQAFLRRLALGLLLLAGLPAEAFSLFPGRKDEVATHLRRADALLARADAAYEAGETDVARRFYGEALKRYEVLQESQPVAIDVRTGATNGRMTEITDGELKAGMQVITEALRAQP